MCVCACERDTFFIHSCIIEHRSLQWTQGSIYPFELLFSYPSERTPEVELLNPMIALFLICFWVNSILSSILAASVYIPINSAWGSPSLPILTNTCFFFFFNNGHLDRGGDMVVLTCISLVISDVEHLFMYLFAVCMFFGKMSIQFFCSFTHWAVCSFDVELHELFVYFGY